MQWASLTDSHQLLHINTLSEQSATRAVLIFKHSTRCSISAMVLSRLENKWADNDSIPCYFLDLLKHRDVSDKIEADYNVKHESPQVLLIKNAKCSYHASHTGISVNEILMNC